MQGSGKGPTTLDLMYAVFPFISARNCFQDLNPRPHGHKATALPLSQGSPFVVIYYIEKIEMVLQLTEPVQ
jgi:hypothetical protein